MTGVRWRSPSSSIIILAALFAQDSEVSTEQRRRGEAQYLIANYWSGSMIRLRRLIRPSLILYIRNYTPLNGDRHFRVKNYESNLSGRLFDSIRKFESIIIRWCRKKIVTVTFSFFLWPSHRDSKWINWRSNRSGRDGGAASNDVYMAQITWSTIRGRDNRDDPFSFPARDYSTLVDFSTKGSAVGNWWSPLVFAAHYIPVISHATDGGAVSIVLPYFMRDEHRLWLNISKICWLD